MRHANELMRDMGVVNKTGGLWLEMFAGSGDEPQGLTSTPTN